ncbi:MAG: arylesterase [Saprospiraceae bacterium]|nr:arylesterase [Saprospiraceae bacterium]
MKQLFFLMILMAGLWSCSGNKKSETKVEGNQVSDTKEEVKDEAKPAPKTIVFFGNSLTAGLGLDKSKAFPALIQDRIDSLGLDYTVVNAGLSGETSSNGASRIDWVLSQKVDVFVLELGANDMLRGLDVKSTEESLGEILQSVQTKYPNAQLLICEMLAPPNMGPEYVSEFQGLYKRLAEKYNAGFIPFFLAGVAENPDELTLDGKHPTAEGQKIVMENVWAVLKDYL